MRKHGWSKAAISKLAMAEHSCVRTGCECSNVIIILLDGDPDTCSLDDDPVLSRYLAPSAHLSICPSVRETSPQPRLGPRNRLLAPK